MRGIFLLEDPRKLDVDASFRHKHSKLDMVDIGIVHILDIQALSQKTRVVQPLFDQHQQDASMNKDVAVERSYPKV